MQREDFHTVIITYFLDRDLPGRIDKSLRRFERAVIVDNASAGESLAMIEDLRGTRDRLAMIRSDSNPGVAHVLWSVWESITGNRGRQIP